MALGYKLVECEGFEADDILGTLAGECEKSGNSCILATGDRDSLQLVSKDVSVRLITTKNVVTYNESKIMEDYGVVPKQLIDIKALQGDTSDNIPGVKGIGQKGASDLIIKFGSIDYIYQNLDSLDLKPAMRKKLTEGREPAARTCCRSARPGRSLPAEHAERSARRARRGRSHRAPLPGTSPGYRPSRR